MMADKAKQYNQCFSFKSHKEHKDDLAGHRTFKDKAIFHLNEEMNGHSVQVGDAAIILQQNMQGIHLKIMSFKYI